MILSWISTIAFNYFLLQISCLNGLHGSTAFQIEKCNDSPPGIATDICGSSDDIGTDSSEFLDEDIILSEKQRQFMEGKEEDHSEEFSHPRVAIKSGESDLFELWPTGEKIPYEIDSSIEADGKAAIEDAINDIEKFTCVRFKKRRKEDYFLKFFKGSGCWSFIGMRKDKKSIGQKISIGDRCESKGEVLHQIMHAFGFLNEHTREDRDIYVQINWENILPDKKRHFRISKEFVQNFLGTDYDYNSIMHYSRNMYSKNGKDTISIFGCSIKAKKILKIIGQRKGLSAGDRYQINKLFKCPEKNKRQLVVDDTFEDESMGIVSGKRTRYNCI